MSRLLLLATSIAISLLLPFRDADAQQGGRLLSATGTVTARARVAARIQPTLLAVETVTPEAGATTILTRLTVGANVPHQVRARLSGSPGIAIELRDVRGQWVRATGEASVVVAAGERAGVAEHRFACRVVGRVDACPVTLEIVSSDPEFPMQVTIAGPGVPVHVSAGAPATR